MNLEADVVLAVYKEEMSILHHDNILLRARNIQMELEYKDKIEKLEKELNERDVAENIKEGD